MNLFNNVLKQNKEYNSLLNYLKNENTILLTNSLESQKSHIIQAIKEDFKKASLIICENDVIAKKYYDDLRFFLKQNVFYYPSKDVVFYSANVKSMDIIKERFNVIKNIIENKEVTVVLSIEALFDRLVKKETFLKFVLNFKVSDTLNIDSFVEKLIFMGYERAEEIEGAGQFAIRGGIIDIYTQTAENAFRIELWGDEIDSIRTIDTNSKRSIENVNDITIYPMRELVYGQKDLDNAIKNLNNELEKTMKDYQEKGALEEKEKIFSNIKEIIEKLKTDKSFSGVDRYIQFFYNDDITLLDYFPKDTILYFDEPGKIREKSDYVLKEFYESIKYRILKGEMLPIQSEIIFNYEDILKKALPYKKALFTNIAQNIKDFENCKKIDFNVKSSAILKNNFKSLTDELFYYKSLNYTIVFISNSTLKCERITNEFNEMSLNAIFLTEDKLQNKDYEIKKSIIYVVRGSFNKGFEYPEDKFIIIADKEIFGEEKKAKKQTKKKKTSKIETFTDLNVGDYVVHENHGIAIFKGTEHILVDGVTKDYLKLEYANEGILYVAINQLDMVQKYITGGTVSPKLSELGSKKWGQAKAKAKREMLELAKDLVALYAKRQNTKGFAFSKDNIWQAEFEDSFPYEETTDQLNAIKDVKKDMESGRIMDRLICGDVGFGKTEVAIRAAFKAVQDGKQVVFLVPTTILASQHFKTFESRMQNYSIRVALLSRFRTLKQQKQDIEGIKKGMVDIVIGTHRVLSKDVSFKDLGLIIIDEEQRFGVRHKEKLKALKENVDVMALSATPIPRTLHMSMTGIRDMSVLEEPPSERMPVQTYVLEYDIESIRNAINRELARNGQVYYLHNRINNIEEEALKIQEIAQEAKVAFAHGQMSERELENVMIKFMEKEIDVLVCTTIIETGLDISNVNTIIINDADKMGLSQLYQLRGRVGRSNRTSYAYLMYKKDKVLQEMSERRLQTIREFTKFGSGFKIAMRDLEIRGAGSILGEKQHGHMDVIGYEMYCKLLSIALKEVQGETIEEEFETVIDVLINAFIPDTYIENEYQKLEMYKKISLIRTEEEYFDVQDELTDRFGNMPKVVLNLLNIALTKAFANNVGIKKIKQNKNKITMYFKEDANFDRNKLEEIIKQDKNLFFDGNLNFVVEDMKKDYVMYLKNLFLDIKAEEKKDKEKTV